jgi:UPF0176 protein
LDAAGRSLCEKAPLFREIIETAAAPVYLRPMNRSTQDWRFQVAALYRFCYVDAPHSLRPSLFDLCRSNGLKGTLLLAQEGINGTVAGSPDAIRALLAFLEFDAGFSGLDVKLSGADEMPFHRMKVRIKREIVTMGIADLDPAATAGTYVAAKDWNALIREPDTIVIDARNEYETALGSFDGAIDPKTASFREFPAWLAKRQAEFAGRKLAMFCTGGIRCEKATAYAKYLGLSEIFHLKGGILKYLEEVSPVESLWHGECFVFDERVSVATGMKPGEAKLCRACRRPLTAADRNAPQYQAGVSCAACYESRTDADRARYAERQRQVELARRRAGPLHIGQKIDGVV